MKARVVDIFCGVGGLAYGLKSAGLEIAAGIDLDPACAFPFEENCKAPFILQDASKVHSDTLVKLFGDSNIRVLAGCAPCQPFSTYAQSRKSVDNRWRLLLEFLRLAVEVKPEIVTMENVTRLSHKLIWHEFVSVLEKAGYYVDWKEVDCRNFGVPQSRKRLVLLASRLGEIKFPDKARNVKIKSVRDTIGHLPSIEAGETHPLDPLHVSCTLSEINMRRIKLSHPGGTWRDWPAEAISNCHKRQSGQTYPSVYGRMEWDKPSPTITTQFYGFGNGRFGHPEQNRAISLREGAILQSFPPKYKFIPKCDEITFRKIGILIGNAVPPLLGRYIGRSIMRHVGISSNA